jgi:hypothetical protein
MCANSTPYDVFLIFYRINQAKHDKKSSKAPCVELLSPSFQPNQDMRDFVLYNVHLEEPYSNIFTSMIICTRIAAKQPV